MHWDHVVKNGTLVYANEMVQANIYIKDGLISAVTKDELKGTADQETDAEGCYV